MELFLSLLSFKNEIVVFNIYRNTDSQKKTLRFVSQQQYNWIILFLALISTDPTDYLYFISSMHYFQMFVTDAQFHYYRHFTPTHDFFSESVTLPLHQPYCAYICQLISPFQSK